jgi:hypothetical protein
MSDPALARDLWTDIVQRIESTDEFVKPPRLAVIRSGEGDPASRGTEALGAAGNAGCVVLVPEPLIAGADTERHTCTILVDVFEDPELNSGPGGSKRRGVDVAECIVARLRGWQPTLIPCSPLRLAASDKPDEGQGIVHRLTFRSMIFV